MPRPLAPLAVALLCLTGQACNRTAGEGESDPPAAKALGKSKQDKHQDDKAMHHDFETLGYGFMTATGGPSQIYLVGDQEFLDELLSDHPMDPAPTIDWEHRAVIIVDVGGGSGKGYHPEVVAITREGELLRVDAKIVTTSWEERTLDVLSRVWVAVSVDAALIQGQPRTELVMEPE
ncbi:MAG: hypothetical protein KC457_16440 [Myxococcales bacterium]|nr:hypothetical protein [Myxococcales bacterium]